MIDSGISEPLLAIQPDHPNIAERMEEVMRDLSLWDPYHHEIYRGHEGAVWSTLSTSDNRYIFSGSEDKAIIIWNAEEKTIFGKLLGHTSTVNALELTEDENTLISGGWDNSIRLWNWRTLQQIGSLVGHTAGVYCFIMTKDKKTLLSGSGDYKVRIWDIDSRTETAVLDCNGSSIFGLAFGKDGKNILAGGWDNNLRIWNFETQALISTHNVNAGVIQSLVVTPDSKTIVLGTRNNVVKVLNYEDRAELFSFEVHNNWVRNLVATSDSNYFITCSADKTMRIVNIRDKIEEFNLEGHEGYVFGLSLSRDGQFLLSGASDKTLRRWPIGRKPRVSMLKGHTKCIMSVAVTSDDKYVISCSEDKSIRIWSIAEKNEVAVLNGHTETIWGVAVTADMKHILSVSGDRTLRIWSFDGKKEVACLNGHENPIFCVAASYDSKFAVTGAQDKVVIIWDVNKKELVKKLEGHTDTVFAIKFTHDNEYFISGAADYTIRIWSTKNLCLHQKIETRSGMIESIALNSDDSLLVLGDRSNAVHMWNWKEKTHITKFAGHNKWVKCVSFASKGNLFASCSNDLSIRVWNPSEQRQEFVLLGHTNTIRSVAFSNNEKFLVSGSEDLAIRLWELGNIENLELADYTGPIDAFVYLSKIKLAKHPRTNVFDTVFSSLRVNLAHAHSYLGNEVLLKKALESGCPIIIDLEYHSPLYYALKRNTQNCVDTILQFMVGLRTSDLRRFINFANALRFDFENLIENGSAVLPEFLEAVLLEAADPELPRFGVPKGKFPMIYLSNRTKVPVQEFLLQENQIAQQEIKMPVIYKTLPIRISMNSGSMNSLMLLECILTSPNYHIYQSSLIQLIIKIKWSNILPFLLLVSILYWSNLAIILSMIIFRGSQSALLPFFSAINIILLLFHTSRAYSLGLLFYFSLPNILSILGISMSFLWIFQFIYFAMGGYYTTWFMVLFNFSYQGYSSLKVFKNTRFYARLIASVLSDSLPFVIIYFYTTLSVGLLQYCSKSNESLNFSEIWQSPYQLNMSMFEDQVEPLQYAYFLIASVFNVIIMLNILIAILGDSFDRLKNDAVEAEYAEMAEIVLETENLMFWKRGLNEKKFLHVCENLRAEGKHDLWEGKVKTITKMIEKYQGENRTQFKAINERLKDIEGLTKICKNIEDKVKKIPVK